MNKIPAFLPCVLYQLNYETMQIQLKISGYAFAFPKHLKCTVLNPSGVKDYPQLVHIDKNSDPKTNPLFEYSFIFGDFTTIHSKLHIFQLNNKVSFEDLPTLQQSVRVTGNFVKV